jgi:hypothetical protein
MSTTVIMVAALALQIPQPHDNSLDGRMVLTLSAEKAVVTLAEPLAMRLSARNDSEDPVVGTFMLEPHVGKARIWYRHKGSEWIELAHLDAELDFHLNMARVEPGQDVSATFVVARDPLSEAPLLNESGAYEFRAEYSDTVDDEGRGHLISNTIEVLVTAPPSGQETALAAYRSGLPRVVEFDPLRYNLDASQIEHAATFVAKYPGTPYWEWVRGGLVRAIYERVGRNIATDAEKVLLKRLQGVTATPTSVLR